MAGANPYPRIHQKGLNDEKRKHSQYVRTLGVSQFTDLYEQATQRFESGTRGAENLFLKDDDRLLDSIGATRQEIYDFIEDWMEVGEPDPETVLRITDVRRDYFHQVQAGEPSPNTILMKDLPSMGATLGSYRWLPRIIAKAHAKLRGEMPPELMYGCGGDRPFLKQLGIDPAEFLKVVWQAGDNEQHVLEYVIQQSSGSVQS